jgi:biotin carboxyl carrier protein
VTFDIEINGRTRTVAVSRDPVSRQFTVAIDGAEVRVDAVRAGDGTWSLILPGESRASATVEIVDGGNGELHLAVGGSALRAHVNGGRSQRRSLQAGAGSAGEQRVAAPMPGRVVRVLVAPGDEVRAGQGLVVVEAMKMENEIRSPKGGRVKEVAVHGGQSVESGKLLVVIE